MSLPTAHSYVVENLMENVLSIEKNLLNPNLLLNSLTKTEKLLNEIAEVLSKDELADEILKTEKENIILLIQKLMHLDCLLYTSDAADEGLGVDLGGRRII